MALEIRETPAVVDRLIAEGWAAARLAAAAIVDSRPTWVSIAGRGTSDHAAVYARYLLEITLGVPVGLAAPSVTTVYRAGIDWSGGLVLGISQSGQSPDVVAVVERARSGGALTVAVTNDPGSPLAEAAEWVLECHAAPERSVAATKTYVAELVVLAQLAAAARPGSELFVGLRQLPASLDTAIRHSAHWLSEGTLVEAVAGAQRTVVYARGYNLATALEIALKLQETGGVSAHGYSAADLEHGPIVLASSGVPALGIRSLGEAGRRVDSVTDRIVRQGGQTWMIGVDDPALEMPAGDLAKVRSLLLPSTLPEALTPVVLAIPGQLLAEAVAIRRGLDPDAPAGLSKITMTR